MTKLEYMQYVREKLQGYDREFVQEILENYEEHFEAGLKNGRSEEEICEELGNIENLLGDIQDVMGDKDLKTTKSTSLPPSNSRRRATAASRRSS